MSYLISGIQQIGIGVSSLEEAWVYYKKTFGMNVTIFREKAEAPFMKKYTGGSVHSRDAMLTVNMRGGGGFEIWQFTSRKTEFPKKTPQLGDTGIFALKIKAENPRTVHRLMADNKENVSKNPSENPDKKPVFFLWDPYGNLFEIVQSNQWFKRKGSLTGGTAGAIIGVSDMENSLRFYREGLSYDSVVYDKQGLFDDWKSLKEGKQQYRRILLERSSPPAGPFSPLFGSSSIELVQAIERKPSVIFKNRFWGDGGFIHLCLDVQGMDDLAKHLNSLGYPLTVDSGASFKMGKASGRFAYVEDPDGTLIELVETEKVPVMKKWNWYMDLRKKPMGKPLPRLAIHSLSWGNK